jgi:hypothetical protein
MTSKIAILSAAGLVVMLAVGCGGKPQPAKQDATASAAKPATGESADDWPTPDPKQPPRDGRFMGLSAGELVPFILGDRFEHPDGRPMSQILACSTFTWKTRGDAKARTELADAIAERLRTSAEKKPDFAYLATFLGALRSHDHILALLKQVKTLDCCFGPALLRSMGECWTDDDVPALAALMDKETDTCRGMVNDALNEYTGQRIEFTTAAECKNAWLKWHNQRKPETRNPKPD